MEFWTALEGRHSVRDFSDEPLSREAVEHVIRAAGLAPSAMNSQPWRFHVAMGAARQRAGAVIAQATAHLTEYMSVLGPEKYELAVKWYSELGGAPVVIGVSMVPATDEFESTNALLSIGAAIENLLLAVTADGLAACNVTFLKWLDEGLEEAFCIGDGRKVIAVIALGHPGPLPSAAPPKHADIADWLD